MTRFSERRCLQAHSSYEIIDAAPERFYDRVTALAARACGASCAALVFLADHCVSVKATFGIAAEERERVESVCLAALEGEPREKAEWAPGALHVAGTAPLVTEEGLALGALVVLDREARTIGREQEEQLHTFALLILDELEVRRESAAELRQTAMVHDGNTEAARSRLAQRQNVEKEVLELLSSGVPLQELLERTALAIDRTWPGVMASILLVDEVTQCLLHGAAPSLPQEYNRAVHGLATGPSVGSCGTAVYRRKPVIVSDIDSDPLWEPYRGLARAHGLRACWSAPVIASGGNVRATFAMYFRSPKTPAEDELELLLRVAELVSIAIERSQKTEELARSQSLLRMASRISQVGAWEVRIADFRLTWSEQARLIHEVDEDYIPTVAAALDFYAPEYRPIIQEAFSMCVEHGHPFDLELEVITVRGRRIWVRAIGEAVRNDEGGIERVQGAVQDISGRKDAEAAMHRHGWLLETAGEVAQIGEWTLEVNGYHLTLSPAVYDMLEIPRGAPISYDQAVSYCLPEQQGEVLSAFRQCLDHGLAFDLEVGVVSAAGDRRWVRARGEPERGPGGSIVRVRGAVQNISDRKQAEQTLREREERFRLVANATSDTIWDWDVRQDFLWWSDGVRNLFGYEPRELSAGLAQWKEKIHPEDLVRVENSLDLVVAGGGLMWTDEYRFRRADGSYALVVDRGYVIRGAAGDPVRMVGSMSDVSERRRLEGQMRESQRLEAIGQLTGGVAHDFNNLLTVILGNADQLADQLAGEPQLRRLADMTRKAAEQGAALTHRLLAFARKQALEPTITDVNKLIGEMDNLLRRSLGEHMETEVVRAGGLWPAHIDPAQLESAILNLCINARDAMGAGGRLTIETANTHLDADYVRGNPGASPGQYVMIAVSDTGTGMPPEVAARAFEPFFTTKEVGKGSGLGLSMVYGFVKQSHGHVKIYSEAGYGTTIKLYLPRARGAAVSHSSVRSDTQIPRGEETILLVEDDDLVRDYVLDQLESLGYRVLSASNGPEAIRKLQRYPEIDLLFTDVVMPGGMNGRILADEACDLRPELAVLFTSGYTENAIIHHGRLDPGVHLLHKPYRRQDLAVKVRQVLDEGKRGKSS